jgi:signal transduction histidine kinase
MAQLEGQINELNRLINDLRPAALERLGLAGALQALAEESAARGGIDVEALVEIAETPGGDEERLVYRLVQEALTNVVKHSGATRVVVAVEGGDDELRITIQDDGRGFDLALVTGGRGLIGMRERIELFGGSIEVASEPGAGTEITATVPLGGQ